MDADCAFELLPVYGSGPVWAEAVDGSGFSCTEMMAMWQEYEEWPGERGGTMAVVNFPDGHYCTGIAYAAAPANTSALGDCDVAGRRFNVWRGEPGQRTLTSAESNTNASGTLAPGTGATAGTTQESLITPSGNIECAILGGSFHSGLRCTNPEGRGFTLSRAAYTPF